MLHGPPPSLFQNYVTTLYQTQDFVAHHGLHSSDAYLLAGPRVDRCADLSAKDYAGFMRLVCDQVHWDAASLKARQPYFQDATLRATFEDGGEVVALVSLREAHGGALVHAAFGTAKEEGRFRVRWVTLLPPGADPDAPPVGGVAAWRRQAHAELAAVPPMTDRASLYLSMLEVSFLRQHQPPAEALSYLPEAHFTCHSSARCCGGAFRIRLSANDAASLTALGYPQRLGRPLFQPLATVKNGSEEERPFQMTHDAAGFCPLLTASKRCQVHEDTTMAVVHDCHVFPYGFTFTPDGVAVWSNLYCPSARYNRGASFAVNEDDIHGRLRRVARRRPARFFVDLDREIPWATFRAVEQDLLRYLADQDDGAAVPVPQRLLAGLRHLGRWQGEPPAPPVYDEALRDPGAQPAPPSTEEEALADLARQLRVAFARAEMFAPLAAPSGPAPGTAISDAPFLPYLLRTLVFSKFLSFNVGVVPGFNAVVLAYGLYLRRFAGHTVEAIPQEAWDDFFSGLQHSFFRRQVTALFRDNAALRAAVGSPRFGEFLLRDAMDAIDSAQRSGAPFIDSAQRSGAPFIDVHPPGAAAGSVPMSAVGPQGVTPLR